MPSLPGIFQSRAKPRRKGWQPLSAPPPAGSVKAPQHIGIRPATQADASAIHTMVALLAAHEGEPAPLLSLAALGPLLDEASPARFWLAEHHGAPCGFVMGYLGVDLGSGTLGVHLGDLYVATGQRRLGVASQLLRALAAWGLEHDAAWMSWTVLKHNREAMRFYRRLRALAREDLQHMGLGREALIAWLSET